MVSPGHTKSEAANSFKPTFVPTPRPRMFEPSDKVDKSEFSENVSSKLALNQTLNRGYDSNGSSTAGASESPDKPSTLASTEEEISIATECKEFDVIVEINVPEKITMSQVKAIQKKAASIAEAHVAAIKALTGPDSYVARCQGVLTRKTNEAKIETWKKQKQAAFEYEGKGGVKNLYRKLQRDKTEEKKAAMDRQQLSARKELQNQDLKKAQEGQGKTGICAMGAAGAGITRIPLNHAREVAQNFPRVGVHYIVPPQQAIKLLESRDPDSAVLVIPVLSPEPVEKELLKARGDELIIPKVMVEGDDGME